jgi:flagellar hook-length control protein FliK
MSAPVRPDVEAVSQTVAAPILAPVSVPANSKVADQPAAATVKTRVAGQPVALEQVSSVSTTVEEVDLTLGAESDRKPTMETGLDRGQRSFQVLNESLGQAKVIDPAVKSGNHNLQAAPAIAGSSPVSPTAFTGTTGTQPLPPEMMTLQLSSTAHQQQLAPALGERVALMLNHKLNSAEIRIDPPHLGRLDIQIQVKDDSASVVIHAQHAQTRDLIDGSSLRLREILQEAGYQSVDVNVSHREYAQGETGGDTQGGGSSFADAENPHDDPLSTVTANESLQMQTSDRLVDYFA